MFSYGEFGELIMKHSRAALRPLLAAHERGALPLVRTAWGVTARKARHNASNARGIGVNRPAFGGTVPHFHQMSSGPAKSADVPHFSKMALLFFSLPIILHVCLPRNAI